MWTAKPVFANRRTFIFVAMGLTSAVVAGWQAPRNSAMAVLLSLLPLGLILVLKPFTGMLVGLLAFLLLPFDVFRFANWPIFRSPLQMIILPAALGAALEMVSKKKRLPETPVYLGLGAYGLIMLAYTLVGHGPDMGRWLYRLAFGLWLFVLILTLVETPRQARTTLGVMWGALLAQALVSIVLTLYLFMFRGFDFSFLRLTDERFTQLVLPITPLALLAKRGAGMPMVAAMLATVSIALALLAANGRLRRVAAVSTTILAVYLLLNTRLVPATGFLVGVVVVSYMGWRRGRLSGRSFAWLTIGILVSVIVIPRTQFGQYMLFRLKGDVVNPALYSSDPVSMRWESYSASIAYFRLSPLVGWGYYEGWFTIGSLPAGQHSTWLDMGYQFGVVGLIPYMAMILLVGLEYRRLLRAQLSADESAMATGFMAAFVVWNYMALLNSATGIIELDTFFWGFAGLAIVWNHWLQVYSGRRLWV